MNRYPMKLGDDGPVMRLRLVDVDELPSDLSGVSELLFSVRDATTRETVLERDAAVVNPSGQSEGHADRGLIDVDWAPGDSVEMGLGDKEGEVQATRAGKTVTWPSEGYVPMTVWQDIVRTGS